MDSQIQIRRDTASNWTSNNPTLAEGEIGLETDTGLLKIGDGTTAWTSLGYQDVDSVDGYDIQKDGSDAAGVINFKTS